MCTLCTHGVVQYMLHTATVTGMDNTSMLCMQRQGVGPRQTAQHAVRHEWVSQAH